MKEFKIKNTIIEIIEPDESNLKNNLKRLYDLTYKITKNFINPNINNLFYTEEEINNLKENGSYKFI